MRFELIKEKNLPQHPKILLYIFSVFKKFSIKTHSQIFNLHEKQDLRCGVQIKEKPPIKV